MRSRARRAIMRRKRLLCIAEAVTVAHVARPLAALARVDRRAWDVTFACAAHAHRHCGNLEARLLDLRSLDAAEFSERLRRGQPLYDAATLREYVVADLDLIRRVQPDLVLGDFRLSLSVSARLAGVRYATLASAYWSPHYDPERWPVPQLPVTHVLPLAIAKWAFRGARPFAFAHHARPLNEIRVENGLPALPGDVRFAYTDADDVLYTDIPELFAIAALPPNHRFVGPALWEPSDTSIDWPAGGVPQATAYVTLGSSGPAHLLGSIVDCLSELSVTSLVSTAGVPVTRSIPNGLIRSYLPGLQAARRSKLVVCNGGSLTCYQALSAGVPIIGVASNLDQFLNMQAIERREAGLTLRADRFSRRKLKSMVERMLARGNRLSKGADSLQSACTARPISAAVTQYLADIEDEAGRPEKKSPAGAAGPVA